jgi:Ca2+-binding RTX toxin-like protein
MRRVTHLLIAIGIVLVVASGVALATSMTGTNKSETLTGTTGNDQIAGGGKDDIINAKAGKDELYGDQGDDTLNGGADNDFLNSVDNVAGNDDVDGGGGTNRCVIDEGDRIQGSQQNSSSTTPVGNCATVVAVPVVSL